MQARLTGAASDALHRLVTSPRRTATVVGAGPHATYLVLADDDAGDACDGPDRSPAGNELVALVSRDAIRVPCAIVLAHGSAALPGLVPGARAQVGENEVRWDAGALSVVRWWTAAAVSGGPATCDRTALRRRVAAARLQLGGHRLPAPVRPALTRAAAAIDRRDPVGAADAVRPVLGLGAGLTPAADDAVAGLLLAARCWSGGELGATVSAVGTLLTRDLSSRTTAVSAGLLRHAAQGRGAPQVVHAVEHLTGRRDRSDGSLVLARLLALGHSSGRDTALGVLAFVQHQLSGAATTTPAHRPTARESA
jgi:hypothetical protein